MRTRKRTKLVHEGKYVAEVDVDLVETDEGWSPYLSLEDAYKLDDVRDALRRGDLEAASRLARIFKLTPVTASIPPEDKSLQSDPHSGLYGSGTPFTFAVLYSRYVGGWMICQGYQEWARQARCVTSLRKGPNEAISSFQDGHNDQLLRRHPTESTKTGYGSARFGRVIRY